MLAGQGGTTGEPSDREGSSSGRMDEERGSTATIKIGGVAEGGTSCKLALDAFCGT